MSVPAGLARDVEPAHSAVTRYHVLDDTGQDMADMRLAVRCGRTVVKHVLRAILTSLHALLKDAIRPPELFDLVLAGHEIHVGRYFFVHKVPLSYILTVILWY